LCERRLEHDEPLGADEQQFYDFGFIALTRTDWKTYGITIVHCDLDRGKWKVTQCSGIPIDKLGLEATSLGWKRQAWVSWTINLIASVHNTTTATITREVQPSGRVAVLTLLYRNDPERSREPDPQPSRYSGLANERDLSGHERMRFSCRGDPERFSARIRRICERSHHIRGQTTKYLQTPSVTIGHC
jgi:hypothetical protein